MMDAGAVCRVGALSGRWQLLLHLIGYGGLFARKSKDTRTWQTGQP